MHLFWHRRDLRTVDNVGLEAATDDGEPVLPVYVFDPAVETELGVRQRAFVRAGLEALAERYRDLGSGLVLRHGPVEAVLPAIATEYDAEAVFFNECYTPARRAQADRLRTAIDTDCRNDSLLVDPATLEASYPTHSQFYADWSEVEKAAPVSEPTPAQLVSSVDAVKSESESESEDGWWGDGEVGSKDRWQSDDEIELEPANDLPPAGFEAARDRLEDFCENGITSYNDTRDELPAAVDRPTTAVSRLSPYIATGMIGIRSVWEAATDAHRKATGNAQTNVEKYRYELSWREHNYHLLYYNPTLATENYTQPPNPIRWRTDEDHLEAWKRGETGYPLVDAGMRQLLTEGYIHNRPRQVVASFLTKHLLIDWRVGERWFHRHLLDFDPAVNAGNWQWIASTGTDSVTVRIFDPVAQMAKYDREGQFVTHYVPELEGVPAETILEWPTLSAAERTRVAPDYPEPIVDRNEAYERAKRRFERAFGIDG